MKFDKDVYKGEMILMIEKSIEKILKEHPNFEIYTVNIWTDPNSSYSSINFDSIDNSKKQIQESNDWNKEHYDGLIEEGDTEQAELFKQIEDRNCNPADFILSDFLEIENKSIPINWEEKTKGKCWNVLEPLLQEIGEFAFNKIKELNVHQELELAVNGREDWYQFTWNNTPSV